MKAGRLVKGRWGGWVLAVLLVVEGKAEEAGVVLAPVVVGATRAAAGVEPVRVDRFGAEAFGAGTGMTVDAVLAGAASFSLFRRGGSVALNPTAQGVSLRGVGPSGAGRALVLWDEVPLNDPFGGWVTWAKVPGGALGGATIERGGGSSRWGGTALGGTVGLSSARREPGTGAWAGTVGDFGLVAAEFSLAEGGERGVMEVSAAGWKADGDYLVPRKGGIDRRAENEHRRVQASWRTGWGEGRELTVTARGFEEARGNGTRLQRNATEEQFLSAQLRGGGGEGGSWTATTYVQRQSFSAFFSAVDPTRTTEVPANDQFEVPAMAWGGAYTWERGAVEAGGRTVWGVDWRGVEGETREAFFWQAGTGRFTRERRAGGRQFFGGGLVRQEWGVGERVVLSGALRVDYWRNEGGFRREWDRVSGVVLRDDRFAGSDGVEWSPTVGAVWQAGPGWRLRAAGYGAFRLPTLNEYYRPFRVGAVTTEANPGLARERLRGVEAGWEWTGREGRWQVEATGFENRLEDAVANVTVGPNQRRRENLGEVRVRGLELGAMWRPGPGWRWDVDWLWSEGRVERGSPVAFTALEGNRLAQAPRHVVTAGVSGQAGERTRWTVRGRWSGRQFEDDENRLRMDEAWTLDVAVTRRLGVGWQATLAVDNVTDEQVETARTAAGVSGVGPGRWGRLTVRRAW